MLVHYLHKVEGKDGTWHSDLLQQWLCFSCWCWHTGETSKGQEEYGFTVLFLFLYHATASISTHLLNRARRLTCFLELQEEEKKKNSQTGHFSKRFLLPISQLFHSSAHTWCFYPRRAEHRQQGTLYTRLKAESKTEVRFLFETTCFVWTFWAVVVVRIFPEQGCYRMRWYQSVNPSARWALTNTAILVN